MEHPVVSVVISSYNRPQLLAIALQSVLQQSFSNLEILVQDDSTEPGCRQLIERLADPRIRYTHNHPALGTGPNLRAGYRSCSGKYFATLNDDDTYSPEYLEATVEALESDPELSAAFSDHYLINAEGQVLQAETEANTRFWKRAQLAEGRVNNPLTTALMDKSVPGMFAVFRRAAMCLEDFPDEVAAGYDLWLTYLAVREGRPICYLPQRLTSYRVHEDMQTTTFADPRHRLHFCRYMRFMDDRFLQDSRLREIWPEIRRRLARTSSAEGFTYLRLGERKQAIKALQASFHVKANLRAMIGATLALAPTPLIRTLDRVPGLTTSRS